MPYQIRARHLWDGEAGWPSRPVTLVVDGERIRHIGTGQGPASEAPIAVHEFGEATILPGLIDMHTHLGINHRTGDIRAQMRDPAVRHILAGAGALRQDLESGVTTAKLNGDREWYDLQMREAVREGQAAGPRLVVSGRGIKSSRCSGGVVATCIADDAESVARFAAENLQAGVDWIKLFASGSVFGPREDVLQPFYAAPELEAAAGAAHGSGKRISVHCFGGEAADACLQAGVDVIDHGWLLSERQLEAFARQGTWLCPTLAVLTHPEGALTRLPDGRMRDDGRRRIEEVCGAIRMALQMDVPLLVGTDAMHGCLADELGTLQELGGKPDRLLRAATADAARALGLLGEIGSLREGAGADLLVVRGNALQDVGCVADVLLVVQAGRIVRRPPPDAGA